MTVAALNVSSGPYTGSGATTVFPFNFSAGNVGEVQVLLNGVAATVPFSISLNADQSSMPGGSVTFTTAPANGATILITSNPSFQQLISFKDAGPFLQSTLDIALDRMARLLLYLRDKLSRAVVFPLGETVSTLPVLSARAGKFLGFDSFGNFTALPGTSGDAGLRGDLAAASGYSLVGGLPLPITPKQHGALGDGVTDDTTAEAAAVTAVGAGGGEVYHTAGNYLLTASLVFDSKHNLKLDGPSGQGPGYSQPPPSQLINGATGSGRFISARSSNAIALRELGIRYSSGSYTGNLIDFSHDGSAVDAAYGLIERCLVGGIGVATAARLVNLETAIICSMVDSHFQWGVVGIGGRREIAVGNVPYSNVQNITRCTFDNLTTSAILNAGESWAVIGNTFEGTNGMPRAYFDDISAASAAITSGLTWLGNWHGDAVAVTDAWFCNGNTSLRGHLNAGNLYDTAGSTVPAIKLTGLVQGAAILANTMTSTVHFGSLAHFGVLMAGNFLGADITNLHTDSDDIFIIANKKDGGFAKTYVRASTVQEFRLGNHNSPTPGPGSFQFNAPAATDAIIDLNGDAGRWRNFLLRTAGGLRWRVGANTDAESGANAGSNFTITSYDDATGFLRGDLTIDRATGAWSIGGNVNVASGKVYKVSGTQVVGAQGAAVADPAAITSAAGTNAAAAPTQAEFNALVTEFNKVRTDLANVRTSLVAANARLRAHGLYT